MHAKIVLCVESNYGNEAVLIPILYANKISDLIILNEDLCKRTGTMRNGIRTANQNKNEWVIKLDLALKSRKIKFLKNMITIGEEMSASMLRDDIIMQIENFKKVIKLGINGKVTIMYNGKAGGQRDDHVICLLLSTFAIPAYMRNPKYRLA